MPGVHPQDILADGMDKATINGKQIRKGTVAAFLANIAILENPTTTEAQKTAALAMMRGLAPDLITIGLHKHVVFNNPAAQQILWQAESVNQD